MADDLNAPMIPKRKVFSLDTYGSVMSHWKVDGTLGVVTPCHYSLKTQTRGVTGWGIIRRENDMLYSSRNTVDMKSRVLHHVNAAVKQ